MDELALQFAQVVGAIALLKFLLTVLGGLWTLVRPSKVKSYGKWAVVTGATDGIGLAYCHEFAKAGMNVILISRTQSKLDDAAEGIKKAYPKVEAKTIQADFNETGEQVYTKIEKELGDTPVGILVNNVGRSYDHAEYLDLMTNEQIDSLVRMNITSTNRMTKMVLSGMVERRKGAIVNIGSAAGSIYTGDPLYTVYSATKAYVDFFSRSMYLEYKNKGICVQCHVPYFVTSKLSKIRHSSLTVPTPKGYAKHSVRSIGYGGSVVPFPAHGFQHYLIQEWLPRFFIVKFLMSTHLSIRKRAYKKKAEKKE